MTANRSVSTVLATRVHSKEAGTWAASYLADAKGWLYLRRRTEVDARVTFGLRARRATRPLPSPLPSHLSCERKGERRGSNPRPPPEPQIDSRGSRGGQGEAQVGTGMA